MQKNYSAPSQHPIIPSQFDGVGDSPKSPFRSLSLNSQRIILIHSFLLKLFLFFLKFRFYSLRPSVKKKNKFRWLRGGSGTSNPKRRTRSASTAPRRIRNGRRCPTESLCAQSAPASTAASASTSPSFDPSPWIPGPKSRSRRWKLEATTNSTPFSRNTASPRKPTSSPSTIPTPPPSTATASRPSPKAAPGGIPPSSRRPSAPPSPRGSRPFPPATTAVGIIGTRTMGLDRRGAAPICGGTSPPAMSGGSAAAGAWPGRSRRRICTLAHSWKPLLPIRKISSRGRGRRMSRDQRGFRRRRVASTSGSDLAPPRAKGVIRKTIIYLSFLRSPLELLIFLMGNCHLFH